MSDRRIHLRRSMVAAGVAALVVVAAAWPSNASPRNTPGPAGAWAIRLDITVGAVPEAIIGVLTLERNGSCTVGVRSSFAGYAHDHAAQVDDVDRALGVRHPCTWTRPGGHVDGVVTVAGVAEPGAVELSFVLAEGGRRLLLLLDGTHPGVVGTGEGFRR